MAQILTLEQVTAILVEGDFERLIGAVETDQVEFKGAPYQLDGRKDLHELAKDVSAMANSRGGIIVLGVATEKQPGHPGDTAIGIRSFPSDLVDADRYHKILRQRLVPPITGVQLQWHRGKDEAQGLFVIAVPTSDQRPHLVTAPLEEGESVPGHLLAYFERPRDAVAVTSPATLQRYLADGLRYDALIREEFAGLRLLLGAAGLPAPAPSSTVLDAVVGRITEAADTTGLANKPAFILAAAALQPTIIPGIVEAPNSEILKWIEHPTQLRQTGFNLDTGVPARLVEGKLRRCIVPRRQVFELWRDGLLTFAVEGDEGFLCWGTPKEEDARWINQLALIESTYLFMVTAYNVFTLAEPPPDTLQLRLEVRKLTDDRPCMLTPGPVSNRQTIWGDRPHILEGFLNPAPASDHIFEATVPRDADPGLMAYEVIKQVYGWFGIEWSRIPYTKTLDDRAVIIDHAQLRMA